VSSPVEILLARLYGVKQVGDHRWIARCPSHEDRTPSLSVREALDGRVLVHCFTGCDIGEIVDALGLDLASLFPPDEAWSNSGGFTTTGRRAPKIPAGDMLMALDEDCLLLQIIASSKDPSQYRNELNVIAARVASMASYWRDGR
jgi:hypothetical protein